MSSRILILSDANPSESVPAGTLRVADRESAADRLSRGGVAAICLDRARLADAFRTTTRSPTIKVILEFPITIHLRVRPELVSVR